MKPSIKCSGLPEVLHMCCMHSLTDVRTLVSRANKDNSIGDAIHCLLIWHHTWSPAASLGGGVNIWWNIANTITDSTKRHEKKKLSMSTCRAKHRPSHQVESFAHQPFGSSKTPICHYLIVYVVNTLSSQPVQGKRLEAASTHLAPSSLESCQWASSHQQHHFFMILTRTCYTILKLDAESRGPYCQQWIGARAKLLDAQRS
jgi:hypothetical protein